MEEVPDRVVLVGRARLVVGVVEEALHPGIAGRAFAPGATSTEACCRCRSSAARSSTSTIRRGSSMSRSEVRDELGRPRAPSCRSRRARRTCPAARRGGARACRARRPCRARRARLWPARLKAGRLVASSFSWGAAPRRSASSGVDSRATFSSSTIVGWSSARKLSSRSKLAREVVPALRRGSRRLAGVLDEGVRRRRERSASSRDDLVRVDVELPDHRVLAAEQPERVVEILERRRAEADRLVQVLRVAREGGAELVDKKREALLERQAEGVLDQVRSGPSA